MIKNRFSCLSHLCFSALTAALILNSKTRASAFGFFRILKSIACVANRIQQGYCFGVRAHSITILYLACTVPFLIVVVIV